MAHTLTFRGAYIRFADLRINEAGAFMRLHLTAELTKPVMEAMDWAEMPECIDSAKLEGTLSSQSLTLTPNQKELRDHAIVMDCSEVGDFQIVRVTDKESTRTELRFVARVLQGGAEAWVGEYLRKVGQSESALKVSYVRQADLPLGGPTDEQRAATSEDAD